MNQVMELLKTADGMILAAAFFAAGMIFMCLACKLFKKPCKCGGKGEKSSGGKFCRKNIERIEKKHPAPADGSIEIYVGNLSYDLTEDVLRKEFEAFGKVNSARIITNRYNGRSKGFGFVHMPNRDEVDAAIKALSEKDILGRKLKCNVAKNVV
jgi:hypothetical protein